MLDGSGHRRSEFCEKHWNEIAAESARRAAAAAKYASEHPQSWTRNTTDPEQAKLRAELTAQEEAARRQQRKDRSDDGR